MKIFLFYFFSLVLFLWGGFLTFKTIDYAFDKHYIKMMLFGILSCAAYAGFMTLVFCGSSELTTLINHI